MATEPGASQPPRWLTQGALPALVLLLLVGVAYRPVWHAGFVWDDGPFVTGNPCVVGPWGLKEIWTTHAADVCPLTLTTLRAGHQLWGNAPLPYHLLTVFLHAANALLLWRVLLGLRVPGAWLGAALWTLHPMQVESVAWITEIKNTQSGLFYLLTILCFLRWLGAADAVGKSVGVIWYTATLFCAALAMASKSSTVVLPVVLYLVARWQEGRWRWRTLSAVGPVVLMSAAASSISLWTQWVQMTAGTAAPAVRGWPQKLATAGDAAWFYLGKLAWPDPLSAVYPRWQIDPGKAAASLPLLAMMALLFVLWFKRRARWARAGGFAGAYYLAALLPVLGLANMTFFRLSFVSDHFVYLASMGPLALAGAGMRGLLDRSRGGRVWWPVVGVAGVFLMLGGMSCQRAEVFTNEETLWRDTVAKNPGSTVARNMLGFALQQSGRFDEATIQYQAALRVNPVDAESHYNLGTVRRQQGRLNEALGEFQQAVRFDPYNPDARNNLGAALGSKGRMVEAVIQFQEAVRLQPDNAGAQKNLAAAQATLRQTRGAAP